jgi:hypothetical protein
VEYWSDFGDLYFSETKIHCQPNSRENPKIKSKSTEIGQFCL